MQAGTHTHAKNELKLLTISLFFSSKNQVDPVFYTCWIEYSKTPISNKHFFFVSFDSFVSF
jgi:hypothetical protein